MAVPTGDAEVQSRGGRWDAIAWGRSRHAFLQATERLLQAEFDMWRVDSRNPPWNRLRFVLVADHSADAFAHYAYGWHTIGMHAGLALRLWQAIPQFAGSSEWRRLIGGLEPPLFDDDVQTTAGVIARAALRWTFAHEVAHCFRGHTLKLRQLGLQPTCNEASEGSESSDFGICRFFELDADSCAADILVRLVDESISGSKDQRVRESGFARVLFAVGLVLLLLDQKATTLRDHEGLAHPHPFVRLQFAIDVAAATAASELKITKRRAEKCAASALKGLGAAARVLRYNAKTWLLSADEYKRALKYLDADKRLFEDMRRELLGNTASFGHSLWFGRES